MKWNMHALGDIYDLVNQRYWPGPALAREARRRAAVLKSLCRPGEDRFIIAHGNSPGFFADLFATWQVGACAVCVNPGLDDEELANVLDFTGARAVLVDDDQWQSGSALINVVETCDRRVPVINLALAAPRVKVGGDDAPEIPDANALDNPALILFTSGTTGTPKGVVHNHRSLLSRVSLNQAYIGRETLARTLCVLPTHFGHGLIGNCLTPLMAGGDLYLMYGGGMTMTSRLGEIIDEHHIRFMSSVPAFWKLALRVAKPPVSGSLRRIHIGSAPLSDELWQQIIRWSGTDHVANMYGITETANWIGGALASEHALEDGLLGKPWGGNYAVLTDSGEICPHGRGEILIQSPSLMSGYFQRPDLTLPVLGDGWYRTGDSGMIDEQGQLRLTGRQQYVINRGGIKIYPEELDLLLERHEEVIEACAFGIADPVSGELVAAAVKLLDSSTLDEQRVRNWLAARLNGDVLPDRIFIVDELPRADRGKFNRDQVAAYCTQREEA